MASNYTTNYKLPLWEGGDDFLRTEFNEAHEKVDAALGTMADEIARVDGKSRFTKLGEYSITQNTSNYTIDISGIDWAAWDKVHLDMYTTNGSTMNLFLMSAEDGIGFSLSSAQSNKNLYRPRLTLYPAYLPQRYVYATFGANTQTAAFGYASLTALVVSGSSTVMSAGAKFILWGEA